MSAYCSRARPRLTSACAAAEQLTGKSTLPSAWSGCPDPSPRTLPARTILIVEDNADARESLAALLRLDGHQVHTASGAEEGSTTQVMEVYTRIGWVAVGVGVAVVVISPLVRKLMHEELFGRADHALAGGEAIGEPAASGTDTRTERRP